MHTHPVPAKGLCIAQALGKGFSMGLEAVGFHFLTLYHNYGEYLLASTQMWVLSVVVS